MKKKLLFLSIILFLLFALGVSAVLSQEDTSIFDPDSCPSYLTTYQSAWFFEVNENKSISFNNNEVVYNEEGEKLCTIHTSFHVDNEYQSETVVVDHARAWSVWYYIRTDIHSLPVRLSSQFVNATGSTDDNGLYRATSHELERPYLWEVVSFDESYISNLRFESIDWTQTDFHQYAINKYGLSPTLVFDYTSPDGLRTYALFPVAIVDSNIEDFGIIAYRDSIFAVQITIGIG